MQPHLARTEPDSFNFIYIFEWRRTSTIWVDSSSIGL